MFPWLTHLFASSGPGSGTAEYLLEVREQAWEAHNQPMRRRNLGFARGFFGWGPWKQGVRLGGGVGRRVKVGVVTAGRLSGRVGWPMGWE